MRKYIAELIGTFGLVFFGTGAIIVDQQSGGNLGLLGIAATFGIVITAMVYVFGSTSGAHMNPAVTISLAIAKLMPRSSMIGYLMAQLVGAILASVLLSCLFPDDLTLGMTAPTGGVMQSLVLELVLTFFLMLTILGLTSNNDLSAVAGLIIGLMVVGMILFAGPISGGSFNPARSIAPALISGNVSTLWIYCSAPTLGAILATYAWKALSVRTS